MNQPSIEGITASAGSFFVRRLARGKHSVAYRLWAEIPGSFSALPAKASAMYTPELKGNSDEIKVAIVD